MKEAMEFIERVENVGRALMNLTDTMEAVLRCMDIVMADDPGWPDSAMRKQMSQGIEAAYKALAVE